MKLYTDDELMALLNWDGLLCKKPFRNPIEERQYYSRYIERMLWRYLRKDDWQRLHEIIDALRISDKLKDATVFLLEKHLGK